MIDCVSEIIGVKSLTIYPNDGVMLVRPNISVLNEVDLTTNGIGSYIISNPSLLPKWERNLSYSGNYKQNYIDEFTFFVHGIENEIPEIIKELRNNRLGYLIEMVTVGGKSYIFESPVFLNTENTKQVDSHSWSVSLSYRNPSFFDKLTLLSTTLTVKPTELTIDIEIVGIKSMGIYINEGVRYNYPDKSKENEVDLIAHAIGSYVISDINELPKWERIVNYSANYNQDYNDIFTFFIHGTENDTPEILKDLRNNRKGYIIEIITTGNKSYVFPSPVFLNEDNTKQVDSHSWVISLSYRTFSKKDKLVKLNTLLMTNSYILLGENKILGNGEGKAIVSK